MGIELVLLACQDDMLPIELPCPARAKQSSIFVSTNAKATENTPEVIGNIMVILPRQISFKISKLTYFMKN